MGIHARVGSRRNCHCGALDDGVMADGGCSTPEAWNMPGSFGRSGNMPQVYRQAVACEGPRFEEVHGELLDVKHMYLPDKDFKILDEKGNPVIYTILSSRDLTNYVLSQMMRLDPSEKPCIPDKVFDAEVAIEAHEVPAMGYAQYRLVPSESSARPLRKLGRDDALENEYYRISVNADGTLRVEDRASGYVYDRQAVLVENGDDGDSFNYSPPRQDLGSVRTRVNRKCRSRVPISAKGQRSTSP